MSRGSVGRAIVIGVVAGAALLPAASFGADAGRFTPLTSRMSTDRAGAVAAPLPDGRVLVAGGFKSGVGTLDTAEIFDPATSTFTPLTGAGSKLSMARTRAAAVALADGRVLIMGGTLGGDPGSKTADVFDPATGTFAPLTGHDMTRSRTGLSATRLADGRVFVVGGNEAGSDSTAEIFDPATSNFTAISAMSIYARIDSRAVTLPDGRVLLAGGKRQNGVPQEGAEVWDPATGQFTTVAAMNDQRSRLLMSLLPDGRVLAAGGQDQDLNQLATAEVYDPALNRWDTLTGLGGEMSGVRWGGTAAPLGDGRVLVVGGFDDLQSQDTAELFERAPEVELAGDGLFGPQAVGSTSDGRVVAITNRSPSTLDIGRIFVEGGDGDFAVAADACTGVQLGQGQSCELRVTFAPSDLGDRAAQLAVLDNAPSRVQRLALSGTGVPYTAPAGPGPGTPPAPGPRTAVGSVKVSCSLAKRSRRRVRCVVKPAAARPLVTLFRLRLVRQGRTVAGATAAGGVVKLRASRRLRAGRYGVRAAVTTGGVQIAAKGRLVVR